MPLARMHEIGPCRASFPSSFPRRSWRAPLKTRSVRWEVASSPAQGLPKPQTRTLENRSGFFAFWPSSQSAQFINNLMSCKSRQRIPAAARVCACGPLPAMCADVAQLVERDLAKVEAMSSRLIIRSISSAFAWSTGTQCSPWDGRGVRVFVPGRGAHACSARGGRRRQRLRDWRRCSCAVSADEMEFSWMCSSVVEQSPHKAWGAGPIPATSTRYERSRMHLRAIVNHEKLISKEVWQSGLSQRP